MMWSSRYNCSYCPCLVVQFQRPPNWDAWAWRDARMPCVYWLRQLTTLRPSIGGIIYAADMLLNLIVSSQSSAVLWHDRWMWLASRRRCCCHSRFSDALKFQGAIIFVLLWFSSLSGCWPNSMVGLQAVGIPETIKFAYLNKWWIDLATQKKVTCQVSWICDRDWKRSNFAKVYL